ncbi:hypothetical protein [Pseudalkalibacillus caeni]|uniref:Uncharacterized protein n=1 Tax=Exobacillus caeni TaxID=2574798 RepID=A0A5R9F3W1_9BACL|nr:hypothetical protein [Pseudalkalibacillus caeni]TLS37080.1 hypothetical protein FCL54_11155 [Pseudalkalibacillus caeni]
MDQGWRSALGIVCHRYFRSDENIEWMLVGSAGSVLQGCEMDPGDVDIYVKRKEDVSRFAELLSEFSLPNQDNQTNSNDWYSTKGEAVFHQTFPSGFSWSKARWNINGCDVEVVHISNAAGIPDSLTGDGIWEGGQYIWSHFKEVKAGEYTIPAVPLEIQLESNLRRKRGDRVEAILNALKTNGYDRELITKALSTQNLAKFNKEMQTI